MTIAPMQPSRTGNPGIVPPWLQGGSRPVTPPAAGGAAPAPAAPATPVAAPISGADALAAARKALEFIPVPGGVIVVDVPGGHDHGGPVDFRDFSGRAERPARFDQVAEQERLEHTVDDVQARYRAMGVKDSEGNDHVVSRFDPTFPNAAYMPDGNPRKGMPADSISVGVDPRDNTPFAKAEDVVAHELAHRIIDHMTGGKMDISPLSEDVAVHESLADTFASLVDDDDWVIGDQLVEPIRVMNDPEQLGHPDNVDDLSRVMAPNSPFMHQVPLANGDVLRDRQTGRPVLVPDWHVIAGIPNKAASIIGDSLGREKLGEIYLNAVRKYVTGGKEIEGLASATMRSAGELFGAQSHELQVTRDAWDAVGVLELVERQQGAAARA